MSVVELGKKIKKAPYKEGAFTVVLNASEWTNESIALEEICEAFHYKNIDSMWSVHKNWNYL